MRTKSYSLTQEEADAISKLNESLLNHPLFFGCEAEQIFFYTVCMLAFQLLANCPERQIAPTIKQFSATLNKLYTTLKPYTKVKYPTKN